MASLGGRGVSILVVVVVVMAVVAVAFEDERSVTLLGIFHLGFSLGLVWFCCFV